MIKILRAFLDWIRSFGPTPTLRAKIDLDANPVMPPRCNAIRKHVGGGKKVVIKKCVDGVYLNGKKLVLHRSTRQTSEWGGIMGSTLFPEVEDLPVQNATLNDFFVTNPAYVPEEWKIKENGGILHIYFWNTLFQDESGNEYVSYGGWYPEGVWFSSVDYIGLRWGANSPAVVVEN